MFRCYICGDPKVEMIGNWDEFADKYDDDQWEECEADFQANGKNIGYYCGTCNESYDLKETD